MGKKINKQRILVIRLSAMGDVAMTIPVLQALNRQNPELEILMLTRQQFFPIFKEMPLVQLIAADVKGKHKGILGIFRLYRELREYNIEAVADLHNVLRSKLLSLFFRLNGTKVAQIDKGRAEKRAVIKAAAKALVFLKSTYERYAMVFQKLGFKIQLRDIQLFGSKQWPSTLKKPTGLKMVGIAPFASFPGKVYPLHLVEEVVKGLLAKECTIYLFGGGQNEKALLNELEAKFSNGVANLTGKFSLEEELNIISNLDVMVSMDSGNGHLAANYGVPVITVWGITHPCLGFAPYGQPLENSIMTNRDEYPLIPTSVYGNKMPEGYEKCMETIRPSEIVAKVVSVM